MAATFGAAGEQPGRRTSAGRANALSQVAYSRALVVSRPFSSIWIQWRLTEVCRRGGQQPERRGPLLYQSDRLRSDGRAIVSLWISLR